MSTFKETLKKPAYAFGSVTLFLFFASWGIWWSFFQIWLTSDSVGLQLSGERVGTVYSINGAVTMVLMIVYGTIQDKLDLKRTLTIAVASVMALIGPFATWVYLPLLQSNFLLGAALGGIVLSAGFIGAFGLFDAFVERISRRHGFEFGQARMWGSAGYAVVALIAGFMFTVNPAINFWISSMFGLVLLLVHLFWYPDRNDEGSAVEEVAVTPSVREMFGLLKDRNVWAVIVVVFLSWTFYTVFDQQMFPDFYVSLFSTEQIGQQTYGVLNSVQVFLEAAMMGVVPLVLRKVGARNTLLLGICVMFVRILACGLFHDPILISSAKMMHALEVPLFVLAMFKYLNLHFNPALSATLYLVCFNLASQLGNVTLSNPLGQLRDSIGYQNTFHVIAGVVAVAAIWAFFVLKPDSKAVQPVGDSELKKA
ncbi:oligosaccharide MFS transporter [uncultured Tessaracoccus sp.]|uniref:oligosaccharide MFS transporter n=1 Tax=uncultured Tessaracoccus sp. TaxID=905023 RepID=UPI002639BC11|nr:oligosaccharide MFS transporter [uncultured Tessaracoccus sp.]